MKTVSTKIKDFNVGDTFAYYGAILKVTGDLKTWTNHGGRIDPTPTYGRECKFVKPQPGRESEVRCYGGLITNYDWMQGSESVTYAKITN